MQGALVGLALFHLVLHAADSSEALQAACRNGDGASCVRLGDRFERGLERGVKDACRARIWFQLACELRHPAGCARLGRLYRYGMCVSLDEDLAATYFDLACNRWYPDRWDAVACVDLGVLYEDGTGPPQDLPRAEALYEKGCDGDAARGCANLGCRLLTRNPERAKELLRKAEAGGVRPQCVPAEPPRLRLSARGEAELLNPGYIYALSAELSFGQLSGVATLLGQFPPAFRAEVRYSPARWGLAGPYGTAGAVVLFTPEELDIPSSPLRVIGGLRVAAGVGVQLGPVHVFTDLAFERRFPPNYPRPGTGVPPNPKRELPEHVLLSLGAGWTF